MNDLTQRLAELYSAVVSDVLDDLGIRDATMHPGIVPLGSVPRIAGRAATLEVVAVDATPEEPYRVQFAAIDALQPGQVLVVGAPAVPGAFWGELITTRAAARNCGGAIVDGYCRDIRRVRSHPFGVWARGTHPADSRGRLEAVSYGEPVTCGGVFVRPGDYILADEDGVVCIPADIAEEVVAGSEQKVVAEDDVRASLNAGKSIAETYAQYGVM